MNKIIKLLLLLFIITISLPSIAQKKERAAFTPGHEVRLGIGFLPLLPTDDYFFGNWDRGPSPASYSKYNYNELLHNTGPRIITGAISFGYSYNILRWLSIGATFSYHGDYQKTYNRITKEKIGENNIQNFTLTPMVRINYLNRPMIRLYSQIGMGIGFERIDNKYYNTSDSENYFYPSGQLTFLGISVGSTLYGYTELLGFGSQGFCITGIGYKF